MIGFLATGNELVEGDILNTNGQAIAQMLVDRWLVVGSHIMTSDREVDIKAALQFLLTHYDTVITIGGLGPTSDDRTRFVLSEVLNKPLVFDETSWQSIVERFAKLKLKLTSLLESDNRQQALFPQDAIIFPNKNGSAAGCLIEYNNKKVFMLPGPPNECLPMFEEFVLPILAKQIKQKVIKLQWLLLGAIEGEIANQIDAAVKDYAVTTGYRIAHPYVEVKIYTEESANLNKLKNVVEDIVAPYLVSITKQTAGELFREVILQFPNSITIADEATGGLLETILLSPKTYAKLQFVSSEHIATFDNWHISIAGLTEYWRGDKPTGETEIKLQYQYKDVMEQRSIKIPFRNQLVCKYAVEFIARELIAQGNIYAAT